MKMVILFINFFLITLILYSFANSNLVEGLSGCSTDEKSAVYRQQALTDRLFSEINTLRAEYTVLDTTRKINTDLISNNLTKNKKAVSAINDEMKETGKKLNKLMSTKSASSIDPGDGGVKAFSNSLSG
jgi:hypothetical protein